MKFDLKCDLHPTYQAKMFPRKTMCEACLVLYWLKYDGFRLQNDFSKLMVVKKAKKTRKQ
jgi:hypothetical protein